MPQPEEDDYEAMTKRFRADLLGQNGEELREAALVDALDEYLEMQLSRLTISGAGDVRVTMGGGEIQVGMVQPSATIRSRSNDQQ